MQRISEFVEDDDVVLVGKNCLFAVLPLIPRQFLGAVHILGSLGESVAHCLDRDAQLDGGAFLPE